MKNSSAPAAAFTSVRASTSASTTKAKSRSTAWKSLAASGGRVVVRGAFGQRTLRADATGRFEVSVPLVEGGNAVEVKAHDVTGNEVEVKGQLQTLDTKAPTVQAGPVYE